MIYNGTFFYLHYESESIVRYDLTTHQVEKKNIPRNRVVRNSGQPLLSNLYLPQQPDNYLDLITDENGVWGVFGLAVDNNTGKFTLLSTLKYLINEQDGISRQGGNFRHVL